MDGSNSSLIHLIGLKYLSSVLKKIDCISTCLTPQVDMLVRALQEMGRDDAASVVLERHAENQELTSECFI